ncbi:hypothetical protein FVEG_07222 [Fusarium verticillioides 7600]|uniref:Myb-like domain-containing protein n=1 Tax=Gibberella moniliformis (strain M3125 / FGSC 7600) TaxID=334819 RepID=W7MH97_GIBM7|nr:hypothetical protein FVEG_07222 [Fusarium verticillioides 7600]EWG46959.1 hypothetical protein FVEG_07222 [Fusarium verticillioides 7600]
MSGINNETPPNALKSWQVRALAKGRTPLPESPGFRPWLETSSTQDVSEPGQQALLTTRSFSASLATTPGAALSISEAETNSNPGYKFWNQDEMKRLIELKREGNSWRDISHYFPGRSIEALRQAYHKRRAIAEEQMRLVAIGKEDQPEE